VLGLAFTLPPVVAKRFPPLVIADQLNVPLPPLALRVTVSPRQISEEEGVILSALTPELAAIVKLHKSPLAPSVNK
jgi:hypothetical protein